MILFSFLLQGTFLSAILVFVLMLVVSALASSGGKSNTRPPHDGAGLAIVFGIVVLSFIGFLAYVVHRNEDREAMNRYKPYGLWTDAEKAR